MQKLWRALLHSAWPYARIFQVSSTCSTAAWGAISNATGVVSSICGAFSVTLYWFKIRYKVPAGPPLGSVGNGDPRGKERTSHNSRHHLWHHITAYLSSLVHSSAVCDRCMTCIQGEWFRCAYCARDLCDACEEVDTHDDCHIFFVFKSSVSTSLQSDDLYLRRMVQVDMQAFK